MGKKKKFIKLQTDNPNEEGYVEWRYLQGMPVGNCNTILEKINEGGGSGGVSKAYVDTQDATVLSTANSNIATAKTDLQKEITSLSETTTKAITDLSDALSDETTVRETEDAKAAKLAGNNTFTGTNTFSGSIKATTPASDDEVTTKAYVDDAITLTETTLQTLIDAKSTVSVSSSGTATDTVSYITVDGVEKKIAGSGGSGDYLPLAGGTMTGAIVDKGFAGIIITNALDNSETTLWGATSWTNGALLQLTGKDSAYGGAWLLTAATSSTTAAALIGRADGTLNWNNGNIISMYEGFQVKTELTTETKYTRTSIFNMVASSSIVATFPCIYFSSDSEAPSGMTRAYSIKLDKLGDNGKLTAYGWGENKTWVCYYTNSSWSDWAEVTASSDEIITKTNGVYVYTSELNEQTPTTLTTVSGTYPEYHFKTITFTQATSPESSDTTRYFVELKKSGNGQMFMVAYSCSSGSIFRCWYNGSTWGSWTEI